MAHGSAVSKLATTTTLSGEGRGDAVSALARANGDKTSDAAKLDATSDAATKAADTATDASAGTDQDAHGDAVSIVAKSDTTAARNEGNKRSNHGAAVSAVAKTH